MVGYILIHSQWHHTNPYQHFASHNCGLAVTIRWKSQACTVFDSIIYFDGVFLTMQVQKYILLTCLFLTLCHHLKAILSSRRIIILTFSGFFDCITLTLTLMTTHDRLMTLFGYLSIISISEIRPKKVSNDDERILLIMTIITIV